MVTKKTKPAARKIKPVVVAGKPPVPLQRVPGIVPAIRVPGIKPVPGIVPAVPFRVPVRAVDIRTVRRRSDS